MDEQYYRKEQTKSAFPALLKRIWKKRRLRYGLFIVVPVASFITFSNRGVVQRIRIESEQRVMLEKIAAAQAEQKRLQLQSRQLDGDPRAIEKVAREKYGMIREGETVYKVKKEQ